MSTGPIDCAEQTLDLLGQEETGDCCAADCPQGEAASKKEAPASSAKRLRSCFAFGRTLRPRPSTESSRRADQQKKPPYVALSSSCFAMSNECLCWAESNAEETPTNTSKSVASLCALQRLFGG